MSKYADDPITVSTEYKSTKRLHHSVVINGRDANVSVEITEALLPDETADDFADRTAVLVVRELDITTDEFRSFFDKHRSK